MKIITRFIEGLAIFSYLVIDEKSGRAAVIDPTRDVDFFIANAEKEECTITDILETHVHADFLSGAKELKHRLDGVPMVHCSGMGGEEWTPKYADHIVQDGDEVILGSIRLKARHTPGHTPEHLIWEMYDDERSKDDPWCAFTGDFLFVGSVGRPDLLGAEEEKKLAHQLYESVFNIIPTYPDFTEIYPAHGAGSACGKAIGSRDTSTFGYEKKVNITLHLQKENEWTSALMLDMPPAPKYFPHMKKINIEGAPLIGEKLPGREPIAPKKFLQLQKEGAIVLDVRIAKEYANQHLKGSLSIPLSTVLSNWAGWLLDYNKPILLIGKTPSQIPSVVTMLIRIGFDKILGYLDGNIEQLHAVGAEMESFPIVGADALRPDEQCIIDVRNDIEWQGGHLAKAMHIPLGFLPDRIDEIPKTRPVYTLCKGGYRAAIAASILQQHGIQNVISIA